LDVDEVILSGGSSHTPKIARLIQSHFPATTTVHAPSTSPTATNPSELNARGAAIQASLISEFDLEDIQQSAHPMVTVAPHLDNAIGVLLLTSDEKKGAFRPILQAKTAVPARRIAQFAAPKEGGDVLIKICEATEEIKVTNPESKPKANGKAEGEDEDEDFSSEEEEEEVREKIWKVGKVLAEAALKGVKKGGMVEVTLNVHGDLGMQVTAREVGGKGGVRGDIEKPHTTENGSA